VVNKYYDHLWQQIHYQKLDDKNRHLHEQVSKGQATHSVREQYESIDKLLMEAILYAESNSDKQYSTNYQWSPVLEQAAFQVKYWLLRIQEAKGRLVHHSRKVTLQDLAGKPADKTQRMIMPQLALEIRADRSTLRALQAKHVSLCEEHLSSLAEVRIIDRNPAI